MSLYEHKAFTHLQDSELLERPAISEYKLQVIDHHTENGLERLRLHGDNLIKEGLNVYDHVSEGAFQSGSKEIVGLAKYYEQVLDRFEIDQPGAEERLGSHVANSLSTLSGGEISTDAIARFFQITPILQDLAALGKGVHSYVQNPSRIEEESRCIWDPVSKQLDKYIGHEALRLLLKTRMLGLVPFKALDNLQTMKIRSIGASVAASLIDLLGSLGAEDIEWADGGLLDPSNLWRMPGGMGDFRNSGMSKAIALARLLESRNPYGRFVGHAGMVIPEGMLKTSKHDVFMHDLIFDADIVLEVVDNPWFKNFGRDWMQDNDPYTPLMAPVDASNSYCGLEYPGEANPFNQNLPEETLQAIRDLVKLPPEQAQIAGLSAVYQMVGKDVNPEHKLCLLLSRLGLIPFLTQTPVSARESAAIGGRIALVLANGDSYQAENVHLERVRQCLIGATINNDPNKKLIDELCNRVFIMR